MGAVSMCIASNPVAAELTWCQPRLHYTVSTAKLHDLSQSPMMGELHGGGGGTMPQHG